MLSRFWWLLLPPVEDPLPPVDELPDPPIVERSRFWSWSSNANDEIANSANRGGVEEVQPSNAAVESSSFWSLVFGLSNGALESKPPSNVSEVPPAQQETSSWWSGWSLYLRGQDDLESDVEDSSTAELFKSAKIAVETARDSCHYAIYCRYGTHDAELAVAGNKTETQPVKYNYKKRPLISNEVIENTMVMQRPQKAELPPQAVAAENGAKPVKKTGDHNVKAEPRPSSKPDVDILSPPDISNADNASNRSLRSTERCETTVLPKLDSIFRTITLTTKARLLGEAFLHGSKTSEKHLYKSSERHIRAKKRKRVKKVVIVSVHSFLPSKLVKSLIGQSTGNAISFAAKALAAIEKWMKNGGVECDIDTVSLEGQGTIRNRVKESMKLLQNWKHEINSADFVFVVANSIASPVAIKLVSEMLISPHFEQLLGKKIGLLSMAGTIFGPFSNTDTKVVIRAYTQAENEVISEMFELQKPKSALSTDLVQCLSHLCSSNVKITMMGSTNDQFVPLYSATSNQIRHPNLFKCVYVDGSSDLAPFMVQLISMALTMTNVGYEDQNLVRDLSDRLQGAASTLGSHGNIFNESEVYYVAIRFALETTTLVYPAPARCERLPPITAEADKNLYNLPWNVRGLINDLVQVKHIENLLLLRSIVEEYTRWEPTSRSWREIRYCFAALEDITVDELLL